MESQPQNNKFLINPENFLPGLHLKQRVVAAYYLLINLAPYPKQVMASELVLICFSSLPTEQNVYVVYVLCLISNTSHLFR